MAARYRPSSRRSCAWAALTPTLRSPICTACSSASSCASPRMRTRADPSTFRRRRPQRYACATRSMSMCVPFCFGRSATSRSCASTAPSRTTRPLLSESGDALPVLRRSRSRHWSIDTPMDYFASIFSMSTDRRVFRRPSGAAEHADQYAQRELDGPLQIRPTRVRDTCAGTTRRWRTCTPTLCKPWLA